MCPTGQKTTLTKEGDELRRKYEFLQKRVYLEREVVCNE